MFEHTHIHIYIYTYSKAQDPPIYGNFHLAYGPKPGQGPRGDGERRFRGEAGAAAPAGRKGELETYSHPGVEEKYSL